MYLSFPILSLASLSAAVGTWQEKINKLIRIIIDNLLFKFEFVLIFSQLNYMDPAGNDLQVSHDYQYLLDYYLNSCL